MSALFDRAGRAIRTTLANGKSTPMQVENMKKARLALRLFIRDIASGKLKYVGYVDRALHDLHTRTEYCNDMLIRDMADVCVTINRLEHGRRRSDRNKLLEAALLCEYLKDEFEQPVQVTKE